MAVSSEDRLLPALLALSEASIYSSRSHGVGPGLGRGFQAVHFDDTTTPLLSDHSTTNSLTQAHLPDLDEIDVQSDHIHREMLLLRVLQELRELVSDVAQTWAKVNADGADGYRPLGMLAHSAYGIGLEAAMYWMFFRMGTFTLLYWIVIIICCEWDPS
jgi:hypothetical protein